MESIVAQSKRNAVNGMDLFLRNFSHVPDERLNWSPAPTAKSALRIAAHTAVHQARFAKMIRERQLPSSEGLDELLSKWRAEEEAVTTREEMIEIFRAGTDEVLAAIDTLTPEDLGRTLDSGAGWSVSMTWVINLPGWHASVHTGQIDYLQTCWGDLQIYV